MTITTTTYLAVGRSDAADRLVEADELLARLHGECGGSPEGVIAVPELLALVRRSREYGLRLSREVRAFDGERHVSAWVEVTPVGQGGDAGCDIGVVSWNIQAQAPETEEAEARRIREIDRQLAEFSARLGPGQRVLSVSSDAADLAGLVERMEAGLGRAWTDFVELPELGHEQPMHWRILDGARCVIEGSSRLWTASLVPLGQAEQGSAGFQLYLTADTPLPSQKPLEASDADATPIGRDIAPVLREPIGRIIANAETIRSRLAGPLKKEYSEYAGDIADAAQHLLGLIDDLADLDAVEKDDFHTAPDQIDLIDAVRRASGILGGKAQERGIDLVLPDAEASQMARAEFRRVMQVVLNLVGNAIRYAPEGSTVSLSIGRTGDHATLTVADQGPGLDADQQRKIFEKFERLGRSGDGGSGLGLYISRRLARAMGGELTVESEPGQGARFTLSVPALD